MSTPNAKHATTGRLMFASTHGNSDTHGGFYYAKEVTLEGKKQWISSGAYYTTKKANIVFLTTEEIASLNS